MQPSGSKKSWWSVAWVAWGFAFLAIELPAAFNNTQDDTLSEHNWNWIGDSKIRRLIVGAFMTALTLHLTFKLTVLPVIIFGIGIAYIIIRWWITSEWSDNMFRWDQWAKGLAASVGIAAIGSVGPFIADGKISGSEWWMILCTVIGGIATYCKTHPPTFQQAVDKIEESSNLEVTMK
jgi:hypothetical protein